MEEDRKTYRATPARATTFSPFTVMATTFEQAGKLIADKLNCAVSKQVNTDRVKPLFTAAARTGDQIYFTIELAKDEPRLVD